MLKIVDYRYLQEDAASIREAVFVEEQGFLNEFDEIDSIALHLVLYDENHAAGTCRLYYSLSQECFIIGRLAIHKKYRKKHFGAELIKAAEAQVRRRKGQKIGLSSQKQAVPFYEKMGYHPVGEYYMDEHCPHIRMEKTFS